MSRKILYAVVIALTFLQPVKSFAWGRKGHEIVAELAFHFLDSATKENIRKYIGKIDMEEAGNWMDEIKSDHKYDYMKPWHYVNVEKGAQYEPAKEGDAISELKTVINELQHKDSLSDDVVATDIKILIHLVGDLHQPLHVGYGSDKGGNDIDVLYLGQRTNLHRVWDSQIIESTNITANDCLQRLSTFDKSQIAKLKETDIDTWMRQPRSLLSSVYNFKQGIIDNTYVTRNKVVIEDQLLIAGLRLASVLKEAFKS